jgi:DnaJ-class molecular chaperone
VTEPTTLSLFDHHQCPQCDGTGQKPNQETGSPDVCRVCQGTGLVGYDATDTSEIPY